MKTTSTKDQKWRRHKKNKKNEDDLQKLKWRQPQTKWKLKTTSKKIKKIIIGCDIIVN